MKKVLALGIIIAMMFALAVPAMALPVVPATAFRADGGITIDGVRDAAYGGDDDFVRVAAPRMHPDNPDENSKTDAATANVWTAWDDSGVYFYLEVYDRTPHHDDFNAESIEIFMDWESGLHDSGEATDEAPFWQIRVSPVDPTELSGYSRDSNGPNWSTSEFEDFVEWALIPLNGSYNNGYIVEMKVGVPGWSSVSPGKVVVFDVQVCDNTVGDGRDGQMFLANLGEHDDNNRWNTAGFLSGRLTLGGVYTPPAADEPAADDGAADAGDAAGAGGDDGAAGAGAAARPAPRTGDAGMIALVALMAIAAVGVVVLKRKTN